MRILITNDDGIHAEGLSALERIAAHLTDDVEYHWHVGSKPLRGKEKMRKFLKNYSAAFEQREWKVLHTAENGPLSMRSLLTT